MRAGVQRNRVIRLARQQAVDQTPGLAASALLGVQLCQFPSNPWVVTVLAHGFLERRLRQRDVATAQRGAARAVGYRRAQPVHFVDAAKLLGREPL